jgi:fermentation-respiration switch protein FrsA (DUF1100 family)
VLRFITKLSLLLVFSALTLAGCSSFLYQPTRWLHVDPAQIHLEPEQISLVTSDRVNLRGWYFHGTAETPKALIVFFHGNAENLTSHYLFDYFIFDYRGYGLSDGEPSPEGTIEDGRTALRWAEKRAESFAPRKVPLVVFGQSLGGAIALRTVIEMKKEIPISLVMVDSTFASYEEAGRSVLRQHWLTWPLQPFADLTLSDEYAPGARISEISPIPLIVMHGDADSVINYSLGVEVYEDAKPPKEFWRVVGGHHIDGLRSKDSLYRDLFLARLNALGEGAHP